MTSHNEDNSIKTNTYTRETDIEVPDRRFTSHNEAPANTNELSNNLAEAQKTKADWLRSEIEKLEGMINKCEHCGKVWDEGCRDYDGYLNCTCEEARYSYKHSWDEFGYNQALTSIITRYKEELKVLESK